MKSIAHDLMIFLLLVGLLFAFQPAQATQAAPLAVINVTTTADEYGSGLACSLREAIVAPIPTRPLGVAGRASAAPIRLLCRRAPIPSASPTRAE